VRYPGQHFIHRSCPELPAGNHVWLAENSAVFRDRIRKFQAFASKSSHFQTLNPEEHRGLGDTLLYC